MKEHGAQTKRTIIVNNQVEHVNNLDYYLQGRKLMMRMRVIMTIMKMMTQMIVIPILSRITKQFATN